MQQFNDLKMKVALQKTSYFKLKEESEISELKIQEAVLAFERGEIQVEELQQVSQHGVSLKYKAEVAN